MVGRGEAVGVGGAGGAVVGAVGVGGEGVVVGGLGGAWPPTPATITQMKPKRRTPRGSMKTR